MYVVVWSLIIRRFDQSPLIGHRKNIYIPRHW